MSGELVFLDDGSLLVDLAFLRGCIGDNVRGGEAPLFKAVTKRKMWVGTPLSSGGLLFIDDVSLSR